MGGCRNRDRDHNNLPGTAGKFGTLRGKLGRPLVPVKRQVDCVNHRAGVCDRHRIVDLPTRCSRSGLRGGDVNAIDREIDGSCGQHGRIGRSAVTLCSRRNRDVIRAAFAAPCGIVTPTVNDRALSWPQNHFCR